MTLADYGAIAEVVGVFGMISSLIYVGYQLQQARVQDFINHVDEVLARQNARE